MGERELHIVRQAIEAIRGITIDAAESPVDRPVSSHFGLTKPDMACVVRRMLHAELVHYLRCDASIDALQMIREAMDAADVLLGRNDQQLLDDLDFVEPYRHHLYATVTTAALLASDREDIKSQKAPPLRPLMPPVGRLNIGATGG